MPLKNGNMAYSRANSIDQLRSALIELVDVVEDFQHVTKQDASRLKKMGIAYAKQDQVMGQKINQLEVYTKVPTMVIQLGPQGRLKS